MAYTAEDYFKQKAKTEEEQRRFRESQQKQQVESIQKAYSSGSSGYKKFAEQRYNKDILVKPQEQAETKPIFTSETIEAQKSPISLVEQKPIYDEKGNVIGVEDGTVKKSYAISKVTEADFEVQKAERSIRLQKEKEIEREKNELRQSGVSNRDSFMVVNLDNRINNQSQMDLQEDKEVVNQLQIEYNAQKAADIKIGKSGVAGFFSSLSDRADVRAEGLYRVKKEEFALRERQIETGTYKPNLLDKYTALSFKISPFTSKLSEKEAYKFSLGTQKGVGLLIATKPEYVIAAPAVGAGFGFVATAIASTGAMAATVVEGGSLVLGAGVAYGINKEYKQAKTTTEKGEVVGRNVLLFGEMGLGGISGTYVAKSLGFTPVEPLGFKVTKINKEDKYVGLSFEYERKMGFGKDTIYQRVAKPLIGIGKIDGKIKIIKGTPELNFIPKDMKGESTIFEAKTQTERTILQRSIESGKTQVTNPKEAVLILEKGNPLIYSTERTRTQFKRALPETTQGLDKEGVTTILQVGKEYKGKLKGSFPQQSGVKPEFIRLAGDIDIVIGKGTTQGAAKESVFRLNKIGKTARVSPETQGAVEVFKKGEWVKSAEFLSKFEIGGREVAPERLFGINLEGKYSTFDSPIGKLKGQSLGKQGVAKGSSLFALRTSETGEAYLGAKSLRAEKDIPDFFAVQKSLAESQKQPKRAYTENLISEISKGYTKEQRTPKPTLKEETFLIDLNKPSPSPSLRFTPSPILSTGIKPSYSISQSVRPSISPSLKASPSISPSLTTSPSPSLRFTPSPILSTGIKPSYSISQSVRPSISPSLKASPSISPSLTTSPSISPSLTTSPSISPRPSYTPSYSPTYKPSYTPSYSPTYKPSYTPSYSPTYKPNYSPSYSFEGSPPPPSIIEPSPFPFMAGGRYLPERQTRPKKYKGKFKRQINPTIKGIIFNTGELQSITGLGGVTPKRRK